MIPNKILLIKCHLIFGVPSRLLFILEPKISISETRYCILLRLLQFVV